MRPRELGFRVITCSSAIALLVVVSCADRVNVYLEEQEAAAPPAGFVAPDAGGTEDGAIAVDGTPHLLECIGTTCPAPWATCSAA